jgi:DNA polymerase III subunit delta'
MLPVPLVGHEQLKARLAASADAGRLPAALLLVGRAGVGKQRLALWLGQRLVGTAPSGWTESLRHPDLTWVFPRPRLKDSDARPDAVWEDLAEAITERRDAGWLYPPPSGSDAIYVATVRALLGRMALTPAISKRKIFVIGDAERMVPQEGAEAAANAFLKALEEPPADTTIILTSSAPDALLPTIRSRVVTIRVGPLGDADMRAFLAHETVRARLGADAPALIRAAAGAPGALLGVRTTMESGRSLLDAATRARGALYRMALRQGAAGARGAFAERLDALTEALDARAKEAVARGAHDDARLAVRGVRDVELAKELLETNVNPQLITAVLLMGLRSGSDHE